MLCASWTPSRSRLCKIGAMRQVRRLMSRVMISPYISRDVFNDRLVRVMCSKMKSSMFMVFCPLHIFARSDHELLQLLSDLRATEVLEYIIFGFSTSFHFHQATLKLQMLTKKNRGRRDVLSGLRISKVPSPTFHDFCHRFCRKQILSKVRHVREGSASSTLKDVRPRSDDCGIEQVSNLSYYYLLTLPLHNIQVLASKNYPSPGTWECSRENRTKI